MTNKLIKLSNWGIIYIHGHDVITFLQGQLTIDVTQVKANQAQLSTYCNPKGRIISVLILCKYKQGYSLFLPQDNIHLVLKTLNKYGRFSKISAQDLTTSLSIIGYLAKTNTQPYAFSYNAKKELFTLQLPGNKMVVASETSTIEELKQEIIEQQLPIEKITESLWEVIDIQQQIPFIDAQLQEKLLAHPLNLVDLNAISFSKGCYMGQEIVARSQYKGSIKKHAHALIITSKNTINVTDKVFVDSQEVGLIINMVCIKPGYYIVLMIIKDLIFNGLTTNNIKFTINETRVDVQLITQAHLLLHNN